MAKLTSRFCLWEICGNFTAFSTFWTAMFWRVPLFIRSTIQYRTRKTITLFPKSAYKSKYILINKVLPIVSQRTHGSSLIGNWSRFSITGHKRQQYAWDWKPTSFEHVLIHSILDKVFIPVLKWDSYVIWFYGFNWG